MNDIESWPKRPSFKMLVFGAGFFMGALLLGAALFFPFLRMGRMPETGAARGLSGTKANMLILGNRIDERRRTHGATPGMAPLEVIGDLSSADRQRADVGGLSTWRGDELDGPYLFDSFSPRGVPYAYHTDGQQWVVFSAGPDGVYNFHPERFAPGRAFDPAARVESTYDPTNGTFSAGDIFHASEAKTERPS